MGLSRTGHGKNVMPKIKILILDDNAAFRQIIGEILAQNASLCRVTAASTLRDAARKMERERWDLVIMDIRFSGENALSFIRRIKAAHPRTAVAVLTSEDLPEYRAAVYLNGADYFISKESSRAGEIERLVDAISHRNRPHSASGAPH
jgi:DNA-binding NarL/FixJ family response regulator